MAQNGQEKQANVMTIVVICPLGVLFKFARKKKKVFQCLQNKKEENTFCVCVKFYKTYFNECLKNENLQKQNWSN